IAGSLDDEYPDVEPSNTDEWYMEDDEPDIEDMLSTASGMERFTDHTASRDDLITRARRKYKRGELPRSIYLEIKERLEE
ncbi:MAG: hypothetical protein ACMUHB_01655, partial [Thermoplasmatota archaeon]